MASSPRSMTSLSVETVDVAEAERSHSPSTLAGDALVRFVLDDVDDERCLSKLVCRLAAIVTVTVANGGGRTDRLIWQ